MTPTPELTDQDVADDKLRPLMILVFSLKTATAALLLANLLLSGAPQSDHQVMASLGSQPVQ
ncbi:hypothetical protein [Allorhizobium terrae]|uniref:Uncharacterized protein n=1 Tax=Allorhizobium terrae TaxID=1848972 RepID=A0A4S4A745_9HYPH|nr:hypothetical protein [Allorhizobium terrae]THF53816.1 hypothetical protein E6C51_01490 [Allorhizobium terrae]TWD54399.1 hypothetical protein FB480_103308 [Agrobacterium vitis]